MFGRIALGMPCGEKAGPLAPETRGVPLQTTMGCQTMGTKREALRINQLLPDLDMRNGRKDANNEIEMV